MAFGSDSFLYASDAAELNEKSPPFEDATFDCQPNISNERRQVRKALTSPHRPPSRLADGEQRKLLQLFAPHRDLSFHLALIPGVDVEPGEQLADDRLQLGAALTRRLQDLRKVSHRLADDLFLLRCQHRQDWRTIPGRGHYQRVMSLSAPSWPAPSTTTSLTSTAKKRPLPLPATAKIDERVEWLNQQAGL